MSACQKPRGSVSADAGALAVRELSAAVEVYSSARCVDCHVTISDQWRRSAHARSTESALYRAMAAGQERDCETCHAPLRAKVDRSAPVASEGVTCESCHRISSVEATDRGFRPKLDLADNFRYGPLCDTEDHYFHRVKCSPLHLESKLCASCHDLSVPGAAGGKLAVLDQYDETTSAAQDCQDCHMLGEETFVAGGAPAKRWIGDHGFDGSMTRGSAIVLDVKHSVDQKLVVVVQNSGAGHAVPSAPGAALIVRVLWRDASGEVLLGERTYSRTLADASGREATFSAPVREVSDTRLRSGESREEVFSIASAKKGEIILRLLRRDFSPQIAVQFGVPPAPEVLLRETSHLRPGR